MKEWIGGRQLFVTRTKLWNPSLASCSTAFEIKGFGGSITFQVVVVVVFCFACLFVFFWGGGVLGLVWPGFWFWFVMGGGFVVVVVAVVIVVVWGEGEERQTRKVRNRH